MLMSVCTCARVQNTEVLKSMKAIFEKHVPSALKARFDAAMGKRVCLIVNERSLNCPPNVAPPLHGALHSERAAVDDDVRVQLWHALSSRKHNACARTGLVHRRLLSPSRFCVSQGCH